MLNNLFLNFTFAEHVLENIIRDIYFDVENNLGIINKQKIIYFNSVFEEFIIYYEVKHIVCFIIF